ncbi:hypothetical protein [Alkalihalobacillus sp. R86527]|uniref:hypothetical protein n=1 Tax=Alkalihalobacillus sp. R86527 TaxID=3093863 RepID=UPI00367325C1
MKIHAFISGDFSSAISRSIHSSYADYTFSELPSVEIYKEWTVFEKSADIYLVILDAPNPSFCEKINDLCHDLEKAFIPIIVEQPHINIGPVYLGQETACYSCYIDRVRQHSNKNEILDNLWRFYEANPTSAPKGFHPADPDLISNWVLGHLESSFREIGGRIFRINLITRDSQSSSVIGVHGCKRCGLNRDEATRSYDLLYEELFRKEVKV